MEESHRILLLHDEQDQAIAHSFECALKKNHISVRGHSAAIDDIDHGSHGQTRFAVLVLTRNAWFSAHTLHEVSLAKMKMDQIITVDFCREAGIMPTAQAKRIYTDAVHMISTKGMSMDSVAQMVFHKIEEIEANANAKRSHFKLPTLKGLGGISRMKGKGALPLLGAAAATVMLIVTSVYFLSPDLNTRIPQAAVSKSKPPKQTATRQAADTQKKAETKQHVAIQEAQLEKERQEKAKRVIAAAIKHVNKNKNAYKYSMEKGGVTTKQLLNRLDQKPSSGNDQEAIQNILDIVDKAGEDGGDPVMTLEDHPYAELAKAFKNQKFTSSQTAPNGYPMVRSDNSNSAPDKEAAEAAPSATEDASKSLAKSTQLSDPLSQTELTDQKQDQLAAAQSEETRQDHKDGKQEIAAVQAHASKHQNGSANEDADDTHSVSPGKSDSVHTASLKQAIKEMTQEKESLKIDNDQTKSPSADIANTHWLQSGETSLHLFRNQMLSPDFQSFD